MSRLSIYLLSSLLLAWMMCPPVLGAEPGIPEHIKALEGKSVAGRKAAMVALVKAGPAVVPDLVLALSSSNPEARRAAAEVLYRLGPAAKAAREELAKAVRDRDRQVQSTACKALGAVDPEGAVPILVKQLSDPKMRWAAVSGLAETGPTAVPSLISMLDNKNAREAAAFALSRIGPLATDAMPRLLKTLGDPDAKMREGGVDALRALKIDAKSAVPELVKLLSDKDKEVRASAAWGLDLLGEDKGAETVAPKLAQVALRDEYGKARRAALYTLRVYGGRARGVIPKIVACLDDEDSKVRESALDALSNLGEAARTAVPRLEEGLEDPASAGRCFVALQKITGKPEAYIQRVVQAARKCSYKARGYMVLRLGAAKELAADAVPYLKSLHKAEEGSLRVCVLKALGDIGLPSRAARTEIHFNAEGKFKDMGNLEVHIWASYAMAKIEEDPKRWVNELTHLLSSDKKCVRYYEHPPWSGDKTGVYVTAQREAANALGRLGPLAKTAVSQLVEMARGNPDSRARADAIKALGKIGDCSPAVVAVLVEGLDTGDQPWQCARALADLKAKDSVPALVRAMNRHASTGAEVALEEIGGEAVPALIETLRSGSAHGRYKSAVLLGKIGGNAEDVKAALTAASEKDALSVVRAAAARALVRLTGE